MDSKISSCDPADQSETEVERMLEDAYCVPPVPLSLLKRLDSTIAQRWGESPQLVRKDPNWLVRAARGVGRSWKTWPVAASLLVAMFLVARSREAHAYTWATVVEALGKRPVIKVQQTSGTDAESRWISLAESRMVEHLGSQARYLDIAQGVVLDRSKAESQAKRRRLANSSTGARSDRTALALLLGDIAVDADGLKIPDWQLVREHTRRAGGMIELQATFTSKATAGELSITFKIDPSSRLPHEYVVTDQHGSVHQARLEYPPIKFDQVMASSFPGNLQVVEVAAAGAATDSANDSLAIGDLGANKIASDLEPGTEAVKPVPVLTGSASLGWKPVTPRNLSADETVEQMNAMLERLWVENGVTPVQPASDEALLRRVYLDLTGRTPTVMEARNYLNDRSPDRYRALVERLLASPDHATHLATVWRTFLLPEGIDLVRFGGVKAFDDWLGEQFASNVRYDQLVRELLLAEGRLSKSGPLLFYSALKLDADQLAGRTARVFLGLRLDCAQCHDDPFEPWTQRDFWSFAAFFARISRPQAALESVSTVMQVRDVPRGEVMMPGGSEPVLPKFLDGTDFEDSPAAAARREQLARWLTHAENPFFARAAANRVWALLFGRGIVEPVDGFGKQNQPRSAELLDLLAGQLVASDFDLRETIRTIVLSRAYRLASGAEQDDPKRHDWFAQMNVKMLTAEQVYDCITVASMLVSTESEGFQVERMDNANRDQFLQQFKSIAGRATEYQNGIPQALTLMNGTLIHDATGLASSGLLKSLEAPFFSENQKIEVLYLATLSRQPTPAEWPMLREYVRDREPGSSVQEPLADILWALLNSAEFTMNH